MEKGGKSIYSIAATLATLQRSHYKGMLGLHEDPGIQSLDESEKEGVDNPK